MTALPVYMNLFPSFLQFLTSENVYLLIFLTMTLQVMVIFEVPCISTSTINPNYGKVVI